MRANGVLAAAAVAFALNGCGGYAFQSANAARGLTLPIVPVVAFTEEQDEWLHDHCAYRGLALAATGDPSVMAPAVDANLGEILYSEGTRAHVATFACGARPPFYRGEIVLREGADDVRADELRAPLAAPAERAVETPPPPPSVPPAKREPEVTRPAIGYVLVVGGAALLAGGGVAGYVAIGKRQEMDDQCPEHACSAAGLDAASAGKTAATASTWLIAGGAAALATGVAVLVLGSSRENEPRAAAAVRTVPGGGVFELRGAF